MKRTSLKDVAEKAGVSLSAVSRVLNNRYSLVSDRTRARVLAIAREMNYQPNHFAQSLKTGRTNIIGVSSGTDRPLEEMFEQPYMTAIFAGLGDVLTDRDYKLLFYRIREENHGRPPVDISQTRLVDGLIFVLLADFLDYFQQNKLPLLRAMNTPFVVITSFKRDFEFNTVGLDCFAGGQAAARHFLEHGYRDFGIVTRKNPVLFYQDLQDGFENVAHTHGVPDSGLRTFACDNVYADNGYRLADQLVRERVRLPRAFFCVEDHLVLGMMQRFGEAGLHVPEDVAFIGFGDLVNPKHYPHNVSSVRQPAHEKGKQAGELLLHMLNHPQETQKSQSIVLDPPLTIRKTCGCK